METKTIYCPKCGEYLGDLVNGVLYKFGKVPTELHHCKKAKRRSSYEPSPNC